VSCLRALVTIPRPQYLYPSQSQGLRDVDTRAKSQDGRLQRQTLDVTKSASVQGSKAVRIIITLLCLQEPMIAGVFENPDEDNVGVDAGVAIKKGIG